MNQYFWNTLILSFFVLLLAHAFSFYFESCSKRSLSLLVLTWRQKSSAPPSSEAAYNSRVHWRKYSIRRMSGQWKWKIKAEWPLKDFRNGTTGFLLSGKWIFFFLVAVVSPPLLSQCARDGYGSDGSSFLLRIQGLASYQHDLSRAGKLTWSMLYLNLEGGPWRKGRDCYFHYCTSWQSFGWLHSKSWELVSAIIFYSPPPRPKMHRLPL